VAAGLVPAVGADPMPDPSFSGCVVCYRPGRSRSADQTYPGVQGLFG